MRRRRREGVARGLRPNQRETPGAALEGDSDVGGAGVGEIMTSELRKRQGTRKVIVPNAACAQGALH